MLKDNLPGEVNQPHYYAWRRERERLGWKSVSFVLPPLAAQAMREWYRKYKADYPEQFIIQKEVK